MNVDSFGRTDIGRRRQRNEDAFLEEREHCLYAVADGLGGLSAGNRASRLAVTLLKAHLKESSRSGQALDFRRAFTDAHEAIQKLGAEVDPLLGAGTTLTAVLLENDKIQIAHAGDSAAYLFKADGWEKLTTDHTEAEALRRISPDKPIPLIAEHTLTRCLGQVGALEIDLFSRPFHVGDRFFLCSDGATRHIQPEEIHEWSRLAKHPRDLVDRVIKLANRRGGSDNITAVAIYID